jgi:hypothetical protein
MKEGRVMSSKATSLLSRLSVFGVSFGFMSLLVCAIIQCGPGDGTNGPTPIDSNALAMTLIQPLGGEQFSVNDTVLVKWNADSAIIGIQPLPSFTKQFSIDSGKNWIKMTYDPSTAIDDDHDHFTLPWQVLDTNDYILSESRYITKDDFLNKGVLIRIVSYPPNSFTKKSGFIFFH